MQKIFRIKSQASFICLVLNGVDLFVNCKTFFPAILKHVSNDFAAGQSKEKPNTIRMLLIQAPARLLHGG
jgi:hypothetical protein